MTLTNKEILKKIREIIRVDHAGEFGALKIYDGQNLSHKISNKICGNNFNDYKDVLEDLEHMKNQEIVHYNYFSDKITQLNVRPTALMPLWRALGSSLGLMSGFMGNSMAMACTEAVEDVISDHYKEQIAELDKINNILKNNPNNENIDDEIKIKVDLIDEIKDSINQFLLEEIDHKEKAIDYNQKNSKINFKTKIFGSAIKIGCKIAISIAKKI